MDDGAESHQDAGKDRSRQNGLTIWPFLLLFVVVVCGGGGGGGGGGRCTYDRKPLVSHSSYQSISQGGGVHMV